MKDEALARLEERGLIVEATDETEEVVNRCREYYTSVQKTWYMFAKSLKEIRDKEIFRTCGSLNLKDFCGKEFPSINYGTIIKTIKVVERFGDMIDARLSEDPKYTLPAYESCYQLINAEGRIPAKKHKDLVKKIFDGKVSFYRFREEMKKIIQVENEREDVNEEVLEEELYREITIEDEDLDVDSEASEKEISTIVGQIQAKVDFVQENIPLLTQYLESNPDLISDEAIELAQSIDTMREKLDSFLDLMEEK